MSPWVGRNFHPIRDHIAHVALARFASLNPDCNFLRAGFFFAGATGRENSLCLIPEQGISQSAHGVKREFFLTTLKHQQKAQEHLDEIDKTEEKLGLIGQPRAIVFHEKRGTDGELRRHAMLFGAGLIPNA